VQEAAEAAGITLAVLSFRAPELMLLEELWRGLKATLAGNRCYPTLEDLTQHAIDWLDAMTQADLFPLMVPVVCHRHDCFTIDADTTRAMLTAWNAGLEPVVVWDAHLAPIPLSRTARCQ
jgi:hypothetical protein